MAAVGKANAQHLVAFFVLVGSVVFLAATSTSLTGCGAPLSGIVRISAGPRSMAKAPLPKDAECLLRVRQWDGGRWQRTYAFQRVGDIITVARPSGEETVIEWACMR